MFLDWLRGVWYWIKSLFQKDAIVIPHPKYDGELKMVRGSLEWYAYLWDRCQLRVDSESKQKIATAVSKISRHRTRYQIVEKICGVPWWVIGVIHMRESACDFTGVLHNGEKIIGTGKKTSLVPKDRGPFDTWEASALDAFKDRQKPAIWTIENALQFLEIYNGTGYIRFHPETLSPYIWSCTNLYSGYGKYVADGRYDSSAKEEQCGCAAMIKGLAIPVRRANL